VEYLIKIDGEFDGVKIQMSDLKTFNEHFNRFSE
jgi:hypothetical protein